MREAITEVRKTSRLESVGADAHLFPVLWGRFFINYSRGRYAEALEAGKRLLIAARDEEDSGRHIESHHAMWPTLVALGRLDEAMPHLDAGLRIYDRERHGRMAFLYAGHDPGACCLFRRGMAQWLLGYPERARHDLQAACRSAVELNHPHTLVIALWFKAWIENQCGERALALSGFDEVAALAKPHGLRAWLSTAEVSHVLVSRETWTEEAISELFQRIGSSEFLLSWRRTMFLSMLAALCADSGYTDLGLRILRSITADQRQVFVAPELLRIEGELYLTQGRALADQAMQCFGNAVAMASAGKQRSFELRSVTSRARLLAERGRRDEARAALAGVYGWFTEGFDTADLKAAEALLVSLA